METTFISIHDLSSDARLLYVSDSVWDILGYDPLELVNNPSWNYFHPDQMPFAKSIHGRGVELDKAAVLNYCLLKHKNGTWVGCECCFTVVYDVLVACTSVYRTGLNARKRAVDAPIVRQLFSSSPKDPRYHMLSYMSTKFLTGVENVAHEPRAALFLNRYTRTLTVMYASNSLEAIVGITPQDIKGKSFYYCIAEECLGQAVKVLESAKTNDSIAYLRFWFRDPCQRDQIPGDDEEMVDDEESGFSDGEEDCSDDNIPIFVNRNGIPIQRDSKPQTFPESSPNSPRGDWSLGDRAEAISHDQQQTADFTTSSAQLQMLWEQQQQQQSTQLEVEAVVSCSSDGLVVVLRRARPAIPQAYQTTQYDGRGLFASPWAVNPIVPPLSQQQLFPIRPPNFTAPEVAHVRTEYSTGPPRADFMRSIREAAVFAWALVGINGTLAQYGHGNPAGEAAPPGGLPVWDPNVGDAIRDERLNGYSDNSNRRFIGDGEYAEGNEGVYRRRTAVPTEWRYVSRPTTANQDETLHRLDESVLRSLGWRW